MSAPFLPWDWYNAIPGIGGAKTPPVATPPFRGPEMQAGPAPPTSDQPSMRTTLTPAEEQAYQSWRATLPKPLQYEGDYDLRGFYQKFPTFSAAPGQHMTDEFKLPNHRTFSNESRYYNPQTAKLGGHWNGDVFVPNDTHYKQRVDERKKSKPKSSGKTAGIYAAMKDDNAG